MSTSNLKISKPGANLRVSKKRISRSVSAWTPSSARSGSNRFSSRWTPRPSNAGSTRTLSMADISQNGGVILFKQGTDIHTDLVLDALMICYVKNTMDTQSIGDALNELGLKCIVIKGDVEFSFFDGKDSLKWSKWNCTKYGMYTIITNRYRAPLKQNETIKCLKKGSMNDNDRILVENVLQNCHNLGTMKVKQIAKAIKEQGRACTVLRETNEYHYYKKDDMRMSWSEWICADHGKYSVIFMK